MFEVERLQLLLLVTLRTRCIVPCPKFNIVHFKLFKSFVTLCALHAVRPNMFDIVSADL